MYKDASTDYEKVPKLTESSQQLAVALSSTKQNLKHKADHKLSWRVSMAWALPRFTTCRVKCPHMHVVKHKCNAALQAYASQSVSSMQHIKAQQQSMTCLSKYQLKLICNKSLPHSRIACCTAAEQPCLTYQSSTSTSLSNAYPFANSNLRICVRFGSSKLCSTAM